MIAQTLEPLPRVNGRHRDKALAWARKLRAIDLRMQGLTYEAIAREMGYRSRAPAHRIINDAQASIVRGGRGAPPTRAR